MAEKSPLKKKKHKKKSWEIWQTHHIEYEPEKTVRITRTEHFFAGRIDSYAKARGLSEGFLQAIEYYGKKYKRNEEPPKLEI